MPRSPEGAASCGDSSIKVGLTASYKAHSCCGAVLRMVCMENEKLIESVYMYRVWSVVVDRSMEHHIQEVLAI